MPAPSWPRMAGNSPSGSSPERVNQSVWHRPVALISTRTSPALGPSSWTVSIERGLPGARATAARTSMGAGSWWRWPRDLAAAGGHVNRGAGNGGIGTAMEGRSGVGGARLRAFPELDGADHLADAGLDLGAPAGAVEHAVMADMGWT